MRLPTCLLAVMAMAFSLWIPRAEAQVLIREVMSREVTVDDGGAESTPVKEAFSREMTIFVDSGPAVLIGQVNSREVSLADVSNTPPPALTQFSVDVSPTGQSATLDWSGYNQFAVGSVLRFAIYVSDAGPFSDVTGLTPFMTVSGEANSAILQGLSAFQDHYFAVVAVDALGNFVSTVTYAAAYVISPQAISREMSFFIGEEVAPPVKQAVSREMDLVVVSNAPPPPVTGLVVTINASGDGATLDWSAYNQFAVGDIRRFDIYLSDNGAFSTTAGLTRLTFVPFGTSFIELTGLTPGVDHYFAVVAVDGLDQFDPAVNYAAAYVISPQTISREVSLFVGEEPAPPFKQVVSRETSIVVPDAAVPAPVTGPGSGFTANMSGAAFGAVDLDWTSYNEVGQNDVVRYRIYIAQSFFSTVTGLTPATTIQAENRHYTVTGLTGGGIYYFAVVAEDALGGFNPTVQSASAQASVSGVGEVVNLTGTSAATSITFTWDPPPDSAVFVRGYRVYFGGSNVPVQLPANTTTYQATNLQPATGYTVRVTTLDPFNSESGGVTLLGATLLPNPGNVTLFGRNGQAVLAWDAAQPESLVDYYAVYRKSAPFTNIAGATLVASGPGREAMLGTFAAVNGMHYAVVTVNILGSTDPAVTSINATRQFQTIDFTAPTVTAAPFPLVATASSNLPVRFETSPAGRAQVNASGPTPLLVAQVGGTMTVTAQQDGNTTFWPADPVPRTLRLPPVIGAFTATGRELMNGVVLHNVDELLKVVALDADGIAQAEFFIRPEGNGAFTSLGVDTTPLDGLTATLPLDAYDAGNYDLKVVVQATGGVFTNETTRTVGLLLGPPAAPVLTAPIAGATVDAQQIVVSGTAARNSQVSILRNGTEVAGPLNTGQSGTFTTTITLQPGANTIAARAANSAGAGLLSEPRTVTLRSLLTVELNPATLTEGGSAGTVRVKRNHSQGAVQVALASSLPEQLKLPVSLSIAAGATEATAPLSAVNDKVAEEDKQITITGTAAGYVTGTATLTLNDDDRGNVADLVVASITAPAQAAPGQTIEVVWVLRNDGDAAAPAGWVDQIFLSDDATLGNDQLLASSTSTAALAAGQTVERRASITLPALSAGPRYFAIHANAGNGFFEAQTNNNSTIDDQPIAIQAALALNLGRTTIAENGAAFDATVTRNGDTSATLNVTLSATPPGALTVSAMVTIPLGQPSVTFQITPVDDVVFTPNRNAQIVASATNYADGTASLTVTDDEAPGLVVAASPASVFENVANPAAALTITRNSASASALTVSLLSNNPAAANVPASVVIAANQTMATVPITVHDDAVLTGQRIVRFTASAPGVALGSATLTIDDDDGAGITLRIAPDTVIENATAPASYGTVTRDHVGMRDVVVLLTSGTPTLIQVPSRVTIPVGATSVDFPIAVSDNNTIEGERQVTITATEADTVLQQPISGQDAVAVVKVLDNEGATLVLSTSSETVAAGQTLNATITRQPGTTGALTVALASSDSGRASVPATVDLADGQASTNFSIQTTAGDTAPVTITATASGLNSAVQLITITSSVLPDLTIDTVTPPPPTGLGGAVVNMSWAVANDGAGAATGAWVDRVFLTTDFAGIGGQVAATTNVAGPIDPGTGYQRTAQITLPTTPGTYTVVLTTDALGAVTEGSERNNSRVVGIVTVAAPYHATVSTDVTLVGAGTPVPLSGQALSATDQSPVPNVPVSVRVLVNGTRRVLNALTNAQGAYLVSFTPLSSEAGLYQVAADHPSVPSDTLQDQFEIIGLSAEPASLTLRLAPGIPVTGSFTVRNNSARTLTGLAGAFQNAAANLSAQLTVPPSLPPGAEVTVGYSIQASNTTITRARPSFRVTSSEGARIDIPVDLTVAPFNAQLVADPGTLTRGMLRGAQTFVECELVNLGGAPTGNLEVQLPTTLPWLTLASPATIPSLAPGERTKFTLQLLPAVNLPLQLYSGNIVVRGPQVGISVPFQFRALSEAKGDVSIDVTDDYTFYTPEAPHVSGATVRLRDPFDQSIVTAQGTTDANGVVTFTGVNEGSYLLEVSAPKHGTYRQGFVVAAGTTNQRQVFLDRQTVTYTWQVVPTEIPDRYQIKLVATFEVDVPVPVVTMDLAPNNIPELADGESFQIDMTLTNHGLIAAEQVSLQLPGVESGFEFTPLVRALDFIAAKSSVDIPIIVRKASQIPHEPSLAAGPQAAGGGDCPFAIAIYSYVCGKDRKIHQAGAPITASGSAACGGGGGGGGFIPVFFGAAGGGGAFFGAGVAQNDDCDPCITAPFTPDNVVGCLSGFLPLPPIVGLGLCAKSVGDCIQGGDSVDCVVASIGCVLPGGPIGGAIGCAIGSLNEYRKCRNGLGSSIPPEAPLYMMRRNTRGELVTTPASPSSFQDAALELTEERAARVQDIIDALAYFYGDESWVTTDDAVTWTTWLQAFTAAANVGSESGRRISTAERASLLALPLPQGVANAAAVRLIDRYERTQDYQALGITNLTQLRPGQSNDFIAVDELQTRLARLNNAFELSRIEGYENPGDALRDAAVAFLDSLQKKTQGVCAQVKIQIDQQAVLTRQAFLGTLEVTNNNTDGALDNVAVTLDIQDENGQSANDRFFVRGPELSGLAGANGAGTLAPGATGRLQFTFIPKDTAAPSAPAVYRFSGTLHFNDNGQPVALPLLGSPVTVFPDARLTLKYFQQRDVFSDDPFTDLVEPSEPFALGLLVTNTGGGVAKDFSITSAQPKIIENQKGLLIDFRIIGTQVGNQARDPSLTVNLGDLDPGDTQVAQFILESSLQGKFVDYEASFEHANELGGAETSLIERVEIHELIHVVRTDRAGDDQLPDFLANDVPDADNAPDTLYLSSGAAAPVSLASSPNATGTGLTRQLTLTQPSGFSYIRLPDPGAGFKLVRATRSDGKVLLVGDNIWQTDRTFPNSLTGALRERSLHLFDFNGTGSYTLNYVEADPTVLLLPAVQVTQLGPVQPAVRTTPLDTIDVAFSRGIDPATFTVADVTLRLNGGNNLIDAGVTVTPLDDVTFRIGGLTNLTTAEGTYVLSVQAGGVAEFTGRAGQGSASAIFAMSVSRLVVVSAGNFAPQPRTGPVGSIDVVFSRALTPASFTVDDLILTRDNGANLLNAGVTFTQTAPNAVRVGGLGTLTATDGVYRFTVLADGVDDAEGNVGLGKLTESFTIDGTGPTIVSLTEVSPSPRSTSVSSLEVAFSEPLAEDSFTLADVALKRGATSVNLAGASIRRNNETSFTIAGLSASTSPAGNYTLAVNAAGVSDSVGNVGTGTTTRTWAVQTISPAAPSKLAITPDRGQFATDARTNTVSVALTGRVVTGVAKVRATDRTTGLALGEGAVTGTTFNLPIDLVRAGTHNVAVESLDAAGNASPSTALATFIDLSPPAATAVSVRPAQRRSPVTNVLVNFSEPIQAAKFGREDVTLFRDGRPVPLPAAVRVLPISSSTYSVTGLQTLTGPAGTYVLTIKTSGIEDIAGNAGLTVAGTTWRKVGNAGPAEFAAYAGQYAGLFSEAVPVHATSGLVSLKLGRTGAFSGSLLRGGVRVPLKGSLDADGTFTGRDGLKASVTKKGLAVLMSLATEAGADAIVGSVYDSGNEVGFVADRVIVSKTAPTSLAGVYTLLLLPDEANPQPTAPQGDGFAFLSVAAAGTLKIRGELADGTKFSQGASITGDDEWPFYVALDRGKGSVFGQMFFRDHPTLSDLDATLSWFRPSRPKAAALRDSFSANLPLVGSRYAKPAANQPVFDFGSPGQAAELALSNGGIDPEFVLPFTFSSKGIAVFGSSAEARPSLKLSLASGAITGSVIVPGDARSTTFKGIVFPKQKGGGGYFIRSARGGLIDLRPAP